MTELSLRPARARARPFGRAAGRKSSLVLGAGLAILAVVVIASVAAPVITTADPNAVRPADALLPPTLAHPFGTNAYGQDLFARTLYAGRVDLLIAAVLVGSALLVGTAVGVVSAWFGGWVDAVIGRIVDIGFAFPFLVLVIAVVGLRGPGLVSLFIAVPAVAWIFYVRLVRADVLVIKNANYVSAARLSGFSAPRILVRHVLPNVAGQVLVYASSDCVYALLLGASVSYLGLGVQPPTAEWGAMVQAGQTFVSSAWWISFFPGLAIVVTGMAFAAIGDGLADRLQVGGGER